MNEKSMAWLKPEKAKDYARAVNHGSKLEHYYTKKFLVKSKKFFSRKLSILDLGAGTGALTIPLHKNDYSISSLDISRSMMQYIVQECPEVEVFERNIFDLSSLGKKFDVVISRWTIPHFVNFNLIVKQIGLILNPNGVLIFDIPNRIHVDFAKKMRGYDLLDKQVYGYDHSFNAKWEVFYACASDSDLQNIAKENHFDFIDRLYYGLFQNNLIMATAMGTKNYSRYKKYSSLLFQKFAIFRFLTAVLENFSEKVLPNVFFHSSLVIFRMK